MRIHRKRGLFCGAVAVLSTLVSTTLVAQSLSEQDKKSMAFQMALTTGSAVGCKWDTAEVAVSNFAKALEIVGALKYADYAQSGFVVSCNFANDEAKQRASKHYAMMKRLVKTSQAQKSSDPILKLCISKWDGNYEMIEHCVKEQRAAKARLGID